MVSFYLLESKEWDIIPLEIKRGIQTIFCGHYGCQKAAHYSLEQALDLKEKHGVDIHYISSKSSNSVIASEEELITELLKQNISVSINDWGLLYRLRSHGVSLKNVYLGRLLSKSIADWVWSDVFFQKETREAIDYLSQVNWNDNLKLEWLKTFDVAGIEVTIHEGSEKSYEKIAKKGFKIIGYADSELVALSRACLFHVKNGENTASCEYQCCNHLSVKKQQNQKTLYDMMGNQLVQYKDKNITWDGYYNLVYN